MATDLTRDELHRLARLGALRRLEELRQEEATIRAAFPDLVTTGTGKRRGRPPRNTQAAAASATPAAAPARRARKRRARKMSAAERRAVSERMRKYWAERRKAKG